MVFVDLETCIFKLVPIYLPTLYFLFLQKKALQMKRDIELQKPVAHTSIRLGKGKATKNKVYDFSKSQRLSHQGEISNVILTIRCDCSKRIKKI